MEGSPAASYKQVDAASIKVTRKVDFDSAKPFGLGLSNQGSAVVVTETDGVSWAVGVQEGAKVLAVNGQPCAGKDKEAVLAAVKAAQAANPSISITFEM